MKNLEELYAEILANEGLKKEFAAAFKEGNVEAFLKAQDCSATAEDVMNYMNSLKNHTVSDDDLDQVAGGGCSTLSCQTCFCSNNCTRVC